jgi:hypothetical protein
MTARGQLRGRPGPGPRVRGPVPRKAALTWLALALLTVGSVGGLGSAPAMAVFGLASVVLYVIPAIVFLVPAALVSAELASGWTGGVYNWVSEGISPGMGFAAVWCQFAQTTFYHPAVLAYIASTLPYVFAPGLARQRGVYDCGDHRPVLGFHTRRRARRGGRGQARVVGDPGRHADSRFVLAGIDLLQGNRSAAPLNGHHSRQLGHASTPVYVAGLLARGTPGRRAPAASALPAAGPRGRPARPPEMRRPRERPGQREARQSGRRTRAGLSGAKQQAGEGPHATR